jgi:hypothetical protein
VYNSAWAQQMRDACSSPVSIISTYNSSSGSRLILGLQI